MLSKADDYPIHQTPEPIAFSGGDRNFYDRYFFNGYEVDGSIYFAVAMGIYPHLNVADCHFSIWKEGRQYCLHGSRVLTGDRLDIAVGPMRISVVEPLKVLRFEIQDQHGISASLTFEGRSFPIEEPRFTRRFGTRLFQDYTRMTQNGRWSGWIQVDGVRHDLRHAVGTRDRSWGIRPIGDPDPQPIVPAVPHAFFWQWTPMNFSDSSLFFHIAADADGAVWNRRAVLSPDYDGGSPCHSEECELSFDLIPGTRWPSVGVLRARFDGGDYEVKLEPFLRFHMKGIGYFHRDWFHGRYHGDLKIEREDFDALNLDPTVRQNIHVEYLCRTSLRRPDGSVEDSVGVFEQLVLGSYAPLGIEDETGAHSWSGADD